jgi:hypothetical protein
LERFRVNVYGMNPAITPRRIGPIGTGGRVVMGLALLALAIADNAGGLFGVLESHELVLGLVVFPAATVGAGLLARRYSHGPLRFTGPAGIAVNCVIIVVLFAVPYTSGAAALFYGASLVVAAWRGQPDCEATILSNVILQRDDQIGCPTFTPIDAMEARHKR